MMIKHECGGNAHSTGVAAAGWNKCICSRCGEVFYRWFTVKMLYKEDK
ncbi:MAG: hypothetical protein K0R55_2331 [Sporomusa sp.]|jgi:hypothetical protein|nr:hypothetical protein [Sporomusa sp.]